MTDTGTITVHDGVATMTFHRHLPYPPEVVWAALTDPAERAGWFGTTVLDPREGGTIEMHPAAPDLPSPDMKRMTGRILVWDPPHVFEHEWRQQVIDDGVVRYELKPDNAGGTLLTFTHQGLSAANARGYIPGTHAYLDRLTAHLAAQPIPDWQPRYNQLAPHYKAWR